VRVMIGGLKMLVPLDKLRDTPASRPKPSPRARKTQSHEEQREVPVRTSDNTCDLRGVRIEAGLEQLDQFIDRLFRVGEFAGFVLHGHGTGAMKAAVREHLEASGHVAHCEPASKDDGGDALTVLWLRG
jgi:DNA mismatch repair protein MutS2